MDIKSKIDEIVNKVKSDKDFASKFSKDPIKAVESIPGVDLPGDKIKALVDGVKSKLISDKAGDVLGSVKNLYKK